jgi:hypothetical protein
LTFFCACASSICTRPIASDASNLNDEVRTFGDHNKDISKLHAKDIIYLNEWKKSVDINSLMSGQFKRLFKDISFIVYSRF